MGLRKTIFGRQKIEPNTFIGGIATTLNTPALIANKLGISVTRIKGFSIVGSDIQFAVVGGSYTLPVNVFASNTEITYFNDSLGLINTFNPAGNQFYLATSLQYVIFPNVPILNYRVFSGCKNLTTITFDNLVNIGSETFTNCSNLENFGNSFLKVTTIGNFCFSGCYKFVNLNFPVLGYCYYNSASAIFNNCVNLETFYAPNMTLIDGSKDVWNGCIKLKNVTLTSLNILTSGMFKGCALLETLNLPSVTKILDASLCFAGTKLLGDIILSSATSATSSYRMFYQSGVTKFKIPNVTNLSTLTNDIFEGTTRITEIDIRGCTSSIGTTTGNNNVFRAIKNGVSIIANKEQQTINLGSPEADLNSVVSYYGATIVYL